MDVVNAEVVEAYGGRANIQEIGALQRLVSGMLASPRVDLVIDSMEHALTSYMPKDRYLCGYDAKFVWKPLSMAPTWFLDFLFWLQELVQKNPAIDQSMQRRISITPVVRKRRRLVVAWSLMVVVVLYFKSRKATSYAGLCGLLYTWTLH